MAEVFHNFPIKASLGKVFPAVSTPADLRQLVDEKLGWRTSAGSGIRTRIWLWVRMARSRVSLCSKHRVCIDTDKRGERLARDASGFSTGRERWSDSS